MSDDTVGRTLSAGYGVPYDPRPALLRLKTGRDTAAAWQELWQELYHQGNVGEGSYAAVPELVAIHTERGVADWNTFALVAIIELARDNSHRDNPSVPEWLRDKYESALTELSVIAMQELSTATQPELIKSILSVLAIHKGARVFGRILVEFDEDEVLELLEP